MKILTWNINGIRASKTPLKTLLDSLDADIICLQETKVTRDQLDEPTAIVEGYNSYFSFSKARSGYSGVATFCKDSATPIKAEEGLTGLLTESDAPTTIGCYHDEGDFTEDELHALDNEGRTIITQHMYREQNGSEKLLTVINVYCPRADPEREERKTYKLQFYKLLQARAAAILKSGSHVIILGDVNTSHRPIDHCDPDEDAEFRARPGRKWLDQFLWEQETNGPGSFIDTYRHFHPSQTHAFTCWNTVTGARATNYGTRIDYIFGDVELVKTQFANCIIHPDIEGSDHCPVKADLKCDLLPAKKCPMLCSKLFPEFAGKQQKLFGFLKKRIDPHVGIESRSHSSQKAEHNSSLQTDFSCESKGTKRTQPSLSKQNSKKFKTETKKPSVGKQSSLTAFFGKGSKQGCQTNLTKCNSIGSLSSSQVSKREAEVGLISKCVNQEDEQNSQEQKLDTQSQCVGEEKSNKSKDQSQVSTWKNLFKGPPPAPLCKGHKEACLLRTVKKDTLNKGRQFWVCPRPDGHKSNPEARCDHFEWVIKQKKKANT